MFAKPVYRQFIYIFQRLFYVVCVECRKRTDHFDVFFSEAQDVCVCAHCYGKITMIGAYRREKRFKSLAYSYRTCTGTAAAMWRCECLVQVYVHNVESHIARTACTEHGIEVCAVVIHQCSMAVYKFGYFRNTLFEKPKCVRVCHHHCRHGIIENAAQVIDIHGAVGTAFHFDNAQTTYRCRCRVGAVCRVGDNHLCTFYVSAAFVISLDYHQPGKFAVRSGVWFERESLHASDFL